MVVWAFTPKWVLLWTRNEFISLENHSGYYHCVHILCHIPWNDGAAPKCVSWWCEISVLPIEKVYN